MAKLYTGNTTNENRIIVLEERRDVINQVSPSFCSAKWLQTTLYLQTGFNHSCHHPSPHKIPEAEVLENPAALHNSKFKKEQRKKMLDGERPKECDYCWNIEDLGKNYFSDRHYKTSDYWAWDRFIEVARSSPDDDVFPAYLEISFSNACNFACAYCSPDISSKWMHDIKSNGPYPVMFGSHDLDHLKEREQMPYAHDDYNPYVEAFEKWFPEAYPHLKVFRITGGEPTMSKQFWKTLDFILENPRPDLEISINTNLGTPPELIDKLLAYTKKIDETCKECIIYTSCESNGKQIEYVRDGMNYDYWISNVKKFLSETECKVCIMTTINVLSLPSLTKWLDDMIKLRIMFDKEGYANRTPISFNYLRFPPHLQVTILPREYREKYAEELQEFANSWHKYTTPIKHAKIYLEEQDQIKRFCDYLLKDTTSGPKYRQNFMQFIQHYDVRRKKDFVSTFPEYKELYSEWSELYKSVLDLDKKDLIEVKHIE